MAGSAFGRVRALFDDRSKNVKLARPGAPVRMLGLNDVPEAGDKVQVVPDEKLARAVSLERGRQKRVENLTHHQNRRRHPVADRGRGSRSSSTSSSRRIRRAPSKPSTGADRAQTDETKIRENCYTATGPDLRVGRAARLRLEALVIGFTMRPDEGARRAAEERGVEIRYYDIIYKLTEDVKTAVQRHGSSRSIRRWCTGHAEVRATFKAGRIVIAGCYVTDGTITRNTEARVFRGGNLLTNGRIASLKRFKEDMREVATGYECGIVIDGFNESKRATSSRHSASSA